MLNSSAIWRRSTCQSIVAQSKTGTAPAYLGQAREHLVELLLALAQLAAAREVLAEEVDDRVDLAGGDSEGVHRSARGTSGGARTAACTIRSL